MYYKTKRLTLIPILLMMAIVSHAQKSISGSVKDPSGEPLIGVSVVTGGGKGTITNVDGNFTLSDVKPSTVITLSYVGYEGQTMKVGNGNHLEIVMQPIDKLLEEVVVVGYGTVKKRDLTGSVASVKSDDITAIPTTNVLEALQGKVAGMDMTKSSGQVGAGLSFTIRGNRSLNASNAPLVMVDGVPYGTDIDIDPNIIESIDILKDASSTAIYGSRGANGVILITTKKAAKGKTQISYNGYYSFDSAWGYPEVMNTEQYAQMLREAYRTEGIWKSAEDDPYVFASGYEFVKANSNAGWIDLVLKNGYTTSHSISMSNASEKTSLQASLQYLRQEGQQYKDMMDRYSGNIAATHKITNNLTMNASAIITYSNNDYAYDAFNMAVKGAPYGTPFDEEGNVVLYPYGDTQTVSPLSGTVPGNHVHNRKTYHIFAGGGLSWTPIKDLVAATNFTLNHVGYRDGQYEGSDTQVNLGGYSSANVTNNYSDNWVWNNTVNYHFNLHSVHDFQAMIGNEVTKSVVEAYDMQGRDLLSQDMQFYNMEALQLQQAVASQYTKSTMVSFFGRLNYKLMERYLLTVNLRADGSSVLAEGHKWGWFPSVAGAWRIIEEPWMKDTKSWLSNAKLRLSYGVSGNSAVSPYQTQGGLGQTMYVFDINNTEVGQYGYWPTGLANHDLGWEKTQSWNFGIDLGFFNNRINLGIDVYDQKTSDLLMEKQIPVTTGFKSTWANVGKTENKGIEIVLSTTNVTTKDLLWTTNLTFTKNNEKIVELADGSERDIANGWFVGEPTQVYYAVKKLGIWQTSEAEEAAKYGLVPGQVKNLDLDGDYKITTDDRMILGTPRPEFIVGLKNSLEYKGIDFSFFLYWRYGSMFKISDFFNIQGGQGCFAFIDYWTPENPTNDYPRPWRSFAMSDVSLGGLGYKDGSFLKVRDITLGYTLPKPALQALHIQKLRIYCTMKNFFEFNKLHIDGYDAERMGSYSFPTTKQFLIGLNVNF